LPGITANRKEKKFFANFRWLKNSGGSGYAWGQQRKCKKGLKLQGKKYCWLRTLSLSNTKAGKGDFALIPAAVDCHKWYVKEILHHK
jgi:hypothetical protein